MTTALHLLVKRVQIDIGQNSRTSMTISPGKSWAKDSTVRPSIPGLPLFAFTFRKARVRLSCGLCPESRPFSFRFPSNELPPCAPRQGFWRLTPPVEQSRGSSRFSPPDCYQPSQAGTSSLLRIHLPPCTTAFDLEFPLVSHDPQTARNGTRLTQFLRTPCKLPHPQSLKGFGQVSGFALFCTLTHPSSRIRFTYAMCRKIYCPICGTRELANLYITTAKGKSLSLNLTSQAQLRKSSGEVCCLECKKEWHISELQNILIGT